MLDLVVQHVTALAEGVQVPGVRIGRIMVEVRGRQHHLGRGEPPVLGVGRPGNLPASPVAPDLGLGGAIILFLDG